MLSVVALIIMLFGSNLFYKLWIGDKVLVRFSLSASIALYTAIYSLATIYMQLINGIGAIRLQLIIYVFGAIISYPLMVITCRFWGVEGVVVVPGLVVLLQVIVIGIQLNKILEGKEKGIWAK